MSSETIEVVLELSDILTWKPANQFRLDGPDRDDVVAMLRERGLDASYGKTLTWWTDVLGRRHFVGEKIRG